LNASVFRLHAFKELLMGNDSSSSSSTDSGSLGSRPEHEDRHADLVKRIMAWAEADDNIRALVVTGSSSRETGAADRFSDRDIEIIARDRAPLLADDAWLHAIAPVWVSQYLQNDGFFDTRLVFFEGARKVDFTIADRSRLDPMIESGQLDGLYERGYRVLLDKDDLASRLPSPTGASSLHALPSATEFAEVVSEFWFEAAHMPTYLARRVLGSEVPGLDDEGDAAPDAGVARFDDPGSGNRCLVHRNQNEAVGGRANLG